MQSKELALLNMMGFTSEYTIERIGLLKSYICNLKKNSNTDSSSKHLPRFRNSMKTRPGAKLEVRGKHLKSLV